MSPGALKGIGVGSLVLSAILVFVGWERYHDNAQKVEAANRMMQSSPFGGDSPLGGMMKQMTGNAKLEPGVPAATTYSLLFAALFGIGGTVFLVIGAKKRAGPATPSPAPTA
jgi:hypothetical protein